MTTNVDPATLTESEIIEAIKYHSCRLGSFAYYIIEEIQWWRDDPTWLHVFREAHTNKLRAYHDRNNPHKKG